MSVDTRHHGRPIEYLNNEPNVCDFRKNKGHYCQPANILGIYHMTQSSLEGHNDLLRLSQPECSSNTATRKNDSSDDHPKPEGLTLILVCFIPASHLIQPRITWEEGPSIEELLTSDWPVATSVGPFSKLLTDVGRP